MWHAVWQHAHRDFNRKVIRRNSDASSDGQSGSPRSSDGSICDLEGALALSPTEVGPISGQQQSVDAAAACAFEVLQAENDDTRVTGRDLKGAAPFGS